LSESNSVDGFKVSFYSVAIRKRVPCEGDQVDLGNMNLDANEFPGRFALSARMFDGKPAAAASKGDA
jgi:hypothetical protein